MKRFAMVALATALAACSTFNFVGDQSATRAPFGKTGGPAVGALVGIATSDSARQRKERALREAGIDALATDGVEAYMDRQEAGLRQKLENTGVSVTRRGERLILNLPGNLAFARESSRVREDFRAVLDSVATVLTKHDKTMIQVGGHSDNTNGDRYSLLLSQQRARSLAGVLHDFGVHAVRLDPVGFGKTRPIATNETATGRARNRRVELTLIPFQRD